MAKSKIALLGAGGQARETRDYAKQCDYEVAFWTANEQYRTQDSETTFIALEDLGADEYDVPVICCVGAPGLKKDLIQAYKSEDYVSIIAKNSYIAKDAVIGKGVTIAPQTSVTSGATIGSHVLVNTGATISHDVVVGDYSTIGPGAHIGGNVKIGEGVIIGIGAIVKHGVSIGDHTYIGAGAVVLDDIEDHVVAYGIPAAIKTQRQGWIYEL